MNIKKKCSKCSHINDFHYFYTGWFINSIKEEKEKEKERKRERKRVKKEREKRKRE